MFTYVHNDTLESEIFAVINITRQDRYIRPLLTYNFSDHWNGALGGDIYQGLPDTQYGALRQNSSLFAEIRYSF